MTANIINKINNKDVTVHSLICNYLKNPLGVEIISPRLSWKLSSDAIGQCQTAYRILVSESMESLDRDEGDLWDTGKVKSDKSIHIVYNGEPLVSRQTCYWKVCVWDMNGKQSIWSDVAHWEMGLLEKSDWRAKWITSAKIPVSIGNSGDGLPAPMLRKACFIDKTIVKANAYICGLGYYDFHINGKRVGDIVLNPNVTSYDKTVLYQTYDITEYLNTGENVFGVILGDGWYNCFTEEVWNFKQVAWRDYCKLLLQLHIKTDDGEEKIIFSDSSWKAATGPIIFNALRNGEFYDARLERNGWSEAGYNDGEWKNVIITRAPGGIIKSQQMTPIRVTKSLKPESVKKIKDGVWVYDFGQNISGWAKIKASGKAGMKVTIKYAERLKEDGDIEQHNCNVFIKSGEFQTDKYILKGVGEEEWETRFTYHGFRYAQVSCQQNTEHNDEKSQADMPQTSDGPEAQEMPALKSIHAQVVHTDFETRGEFECSNDLLNSIQRCAKWSTLTNYHGIPTDCPHREKNGWTGDAQLSAEQVLLNFDPMTAYYKWMNDLKDAQRLSGQLPGIVPTGGWGYNWGSGPAWDSAIILIPWYIYTYCGDVTILGDMYDAMKKYVEFMTSMEENNIVDFGLGDWCPPKGGRHIKKASVALTDTAYYYIDSLILSKAAALLSQAEDANYFSKQAEEIRVAIKDKFIDFTTGNVGDNGQTSLACVLYQGILNNHEAKKILENLTDEIARCEDHIDCGILGTKYVLNALTEYGRTDLAYAIATQKTHPSWGYWIEQGATTLWEDWEGSSSLNHHMFSDISAWFYKGLAGINPDPTESGFKHIIIKPNPVGDLKWVKAWHESMYGRIECEWKIENGIFNLKISVPANCHATVYMPYSNNGGQIEHRVGSGRYLFEEKAVL